MSPRPPELVEPFIQEGRDLLDTCEHALLAVERMHADERASVATALRALHSFKGNCGFLELGDLERVAHAAEALLDATQSGEVPANHEVLGALLDAIDALRNALPRVRTEAPLPDAEVRAAMLERVERVSKRLVRQSRLGNILLERGDIDARDLDDALSAGVPVGVALSEMGAVGPGQIEAALLEQARRRGRVADQPTTEAPLSIRVATSDLDRLVTQASRLRARHRELRARMSDSSLDALADEAEHGIEAIQAHVLALRRTTLGVTLRRMSRVVRDAASRLEKQAHLVVSGESIEVDRAVAELLVEPLVHLLRNAVDHGIEMPEERLAAGKPAMGRVDLEGELDGDQLHVRVRDDGRGLDLRRVRERALQLDLVTAAQAEALDDAQVASLVFEAGLSTAIAVSSLSGRGVGMDIVRRHIRRLRGTIRLETQPGVGTTITLCLPAPLDPRVED